jgi:putative inorganic carbon (HCO3(-)) transporter
MLIARASVWISFLGGDIATHEGWLSTAMVPLLLLFGRRIHFRRTPLDLPILLLLLMAFVTLWATALPDLTQIAVLQLLAGITVCYTIASWASTRERIWRASLALMGLGLALSLIAPVGVEWQSGKLFSLPQAYALLPLLLQDPIHPNVMAGALGLIMPLAMALAWSNRDGVRTDGGVCPRVPRLALGTSWLLMAAVLFLTKSRGAYIATIAVLVIAALHSRWFIAVLPLGLPGLAAACRRIGAHQLVDLLTTSQDIGSWERRQEVWSRAIYMTQDFPFTGIGMGTFNQVAQAMYPFLLIGPDAEVPHAHNLFLQVGVDLGVPGLVAYLALVLLCFGMAWRVYARSPAAGFPRALAIGLLGSHTALVVHGLTDAVAWAAKPAIIAWAIFGLTAAVHRLTEGGGEEQVQETA